MVGWQAGGQGRAWSPDFCILRVTLLPGGILHITSVSQADVGTYRCVARNVANTRHSQDAWLTLSGKQGPGQSVGTGQRGGCASAAGSGCGRRGALWHRDFVRTGVWSHTICEALCWVGAGATEPTHQPGRISGFLELIFVEREGLWECGTALGVDLRRPGVSGGSSPKAGC